MTKTLQDLIDESIFLSTEYQARLAEISQSSEWTVDFSAPSFTLQSDSSVTLTPYLLGTESENRGSWIWSWQELGHFPDAVVSAAIQAREFGVQQGISELTTDELPLSEGLARRVTLASKAVSGIYAHYPVTAGAGVRAWILVEGDALELEAPTVNRMGRVMAESLKNNTIVNQQRAVDSYARMRGAHIEWDTEATAVITATDGALRLWFDNGKISGIEVADPAVDSQDLNRCAENAVSLRESKAAERREVERIAASEAEQQKQERERAQRAEDQAREAEEARREQERTEQEAAQNQQPEIPEFMAEPAQPEVEERIEEEEIEGVTTTDRVYPDAEQPYDQEPSENVKPGRVTTSGVPSEQLVDEDRSTDDGRRAEQHVAEEPAATGVDESLKAPAREVVEEDRQQEAEERFSTDEHAAQEEAQQGHSRPAAFRVAGDAPDLEAEREDAESAPRKKEEKKGFFSRFFGL